MPSLNLKDYIIGANSLIDTVNGVVPRIYFNNASTTLMLKPVNERLQELLPAYTYTRITNRNSDVLTDMYEEVRDIVLEIVGGDYIEDQVIYTKNATSSINLLSELLYQEDKEQIVLSTKMEHLSNYLPYKVKLNTELIELNKDGTIDMCDYENKLIKYKGKVKLVAVTGASNITGICPPIYLMAKLAHKYGARIFVDIVQLVQHKPFSMKDHNCDEHIDFVAFSSHKCYSGLECGVLVGSRNFFKKFKPLEYGSGITKFVSSEKIILSRGTERFETGYRDLLGVIIMGEALNFLMGVGLDIIAEYERNLYNYLVDKLKEVPNIIIYERNNRNSGVPCVAFNFKQISFKELANELGYVHGIEVGEGKLGADLYVQFLLGINDEEAFKVFNSSSEYGIVRASLSMYNSCEEIDRFILSLKEISSWFS